RSSARIGRQRTGSSVGFGTVAIALEALTRVALGGGQRDAMTHVERLRIGGVRTFARGKARERELADGARRRLCIRVDARQREARGELGIHAIAVTAAMPRA